MKAGPQTHSQGGDGGMIAGYYQTAQSQCLKKMYRYIVCLCVCVCVCMCVCVQVHQQVSAATSSSSPSEPSCCPNPLTLAHTVSYDLETCSQPEAQELFDLLTSPHMDVSAF